MFSFFLRRGNLFFSLAAAVFFVLVVWKAIHMGFTYDEAYSFLHYARASFADIFAYVGPLPANNHLLNTLSMKLFSSVFGISEIFLRMGSILGTCMYIRGVFLFTRYFGQKYAPLYYMTPVLFFTNPYVFDFLVVARGYSLAMGFSLLGIYYFTQLFLEGDTTVRAGLFFLFLSLATLANLSLLNLYLGMLVVYAIFRGYLSLRRGTYKIVFVRAGMLLLSIGLLASVYVVAVRAMQMADDLRFGGYVSIFADTYASLVSGYMYESQNSLLRGLVVTLCVAVFGAAFWKSIVYVLDVVGIYHFLPRDERSSYAVGRDGYVLVTIFLNVFVVVSIALVLQHLRLGTPYLIARTALFFYVLFYLLVLSLLAAWGLTIRGRRYVFLGVCLVMHFFLSLNVSYIPYWKSDSETKYMVQTMKKIIESRNVTGIVLDEDWRLEPVVEFYLSLYGLDASGEVVAYTERTSLLPIHYRYLVEESYRQRVGRGETLEVIERYPLAGAVLVGVRK